MFDVVQNCDTLTSCRLLFTENSSNISFNLNQLEKLEAAKAARLVYLSLLSLTGSFLASLGLT